MPSAMSSSLADPRAAASDDVALGWECADPALQIAMWGQEVSESGPAAAISA